MDALPQYAHHFASFRHFDARGCDEAGEFSVLLEVRDWPNETALLHCVIRGRELQGASIPALLSEASDVEWLELTHLVRVEWNGVEKWATLAERFLPSSDSNRRPAFLFTLTLSAEGKSIRSSPWDTLQDAFEEMHEASAGVAEWSLRTCYRCSLAGHARDYANSDRQYWCYRDSPEGAEGKGALHEARFSGSYYVHAFHTCAAWRPLSMKAA